MAVRTGCGRRKYIDSVLDSFEKGDVLILQNEINGIEDILEKAYARGISIVLNPSPFEDCILSWQAGKGFPVFSSMR